MNYELAKKLKDAGFPQIFKGGDVVFYNEKKYIHLGAGHNGNEDLYAEYAFSCCLDEFNKEDSNLNINNHIFNIEDSEIILVPSLEELIKACGDVHFSVNKIEGRYFIRFIDSDDGHGNELDFWLEELTTAFAYYWLELNKK